MPMKPVANAVGAVCDRCGATFITARSPQSCLCAHCLLARMAQRHLRPLIERIDQTGGF
jgi:hypothetical protein